MCFDGFFSIGTCKTITGPSPKSTCIFPFTVNGIKYYNCKQGEGSYTKKYWCPTRLNFDGSYSKSQWGWCGDSCPKTAPAVIPTAEG